MKESGLHNKASPHACETEIVALPGLGIMCQYMSAVAPGLTGDGTGAYRFLRWVLRGSVRRFLSGLEDPRAAQTEVLRQLIAGAKGTEFGATHQLDRVKTLDEFRAAVPVRTHEDLLPWLDRVAAGERSVLTREPVLQLLETSGTTGTPKHLPVTASWARKVQEAQALWTLGLIQEQKGVSRGEVLTVVSPERHATSPGGIPIGSNTGRIRRAQPWWLRNRYAVPAAVIGIADPVARQYALLRFAISAQVSSWTTANPSMILLLCRRLQEWRGELSADLAGGTLRHGPAASLSELERAPLERMLQPGQPPEDWRPCSFWPLAAVNCWTQGPAAYFAARLPEALGGDVPIRDVGLRASEGFFAFPMRTDDPGSVLWSGGHLLEFIGDDGLARWSWELEVGEEVRLVVSTQAGLYRYDLADRIVVVGRCGRSPVVRFVGKHGRFLNAIGEKVTAAQVSAAMDVAAGLVGHSPVGFCARVRQGEVPVFEVAVEGDGDPARLLQAFDTALTEQNVEYAGKRKSGRLGAPEPVILAEGSFARYREDRVREGAPEGQVKDPILALDDHTWAQVVAP